MEKIEKLQPRAFTRFCMTIGAVPSSYLEGMSIERQLLWFCSYLEKEVIPAVNNNAGAVEELQALYTELRSYVDHYFDNLDVQEEINNKLDAMVESGELQDILAQLIYTLKVYDNINDMKDDTTLADGQKIYCYGYSEKGDKGAGYYYVTDEELTANDLTIIELDNGLFAKLVYDDHINVVDTSVLTTSLITTMLNNNVMLYTDTPIELEQSIVIHNDNVKIHDMKFKGAKVGDNSLYVLQIDKQQEGGIDNVVIENCYFEGKSSNFIRMLNGKNCKIINNTFNGTDYYTTIPVTIMWSNNIIVDGNAFIDNSGFNLQTVFSSLVTISNNSFKNPHIEGSYTATGGEQSIQFITAYNPLRYAMKVNGSYISNDDISLSYNESTKQLTITFDSALQNGDTVYFRGYKSLECININSNTYDTTITNNIIDGTGDSGIVLGSDYHNQVNDPGHTTYTDFPRRITVSNNVVTNCAYAGIGVVYQCDDSTITGNVISNCGWLTDSTYSTGIFTPMMKSTICDNSITNVAIDEYRKEQGQMKYGIYISPLGVLTNDELQQYLYLENKIIVKNNKIRNVEENIKVYPFSNFGCQLGVDFDSSAETEFPELNGLTQSSGYFGLGGTASESLDTSDTIDGVNSMKVTFGATGQYYVFNNDVNNNVTNKKIKISFFAKASDTHKSAHIVYGVAGLGNKQNHVKQALTTEWQLYEMEIMVAMKPNIFQFRLVSDEGTGYALISHIKYSMQNLECK